MTKARKGENAAKDEENGETKKILEAMAKMKIEILTDGENKNDAVLEKIQHLDVKLSDSIDLHSERLDSLETFKKDTVKTLSDLKRETSQMNDQLKSLSKKLVDNTAHSRRLNLDFLGFKEDADLEVRKKEEVIPLLRQFWVNVLGIQQHVAEAILIRDSHRISKYDATAKYPRIIKCGFVLMKDRNLILKSAFKCKDTAYAIRVDLVPELVPIQQSNLALKKKILEENPDALAACTFKNYVPILLVKWRGKAQVYDPTKMKIEELQPGDRRD